MKDEDKTREQLINELIELRTFIKQQNTREQPALQSHHISSTLNQLSADKSETFNWYNESQQAVYKTKTYHISELIDIPLLQQLFNSFYELTGIMHALLDVDTNILTRTGWSDICLNFHRTCPQTECRCSQSDSYISSHLQDGPYISYKCLNGLMDYATPIIVEGQHLGTIYMGQLLHEKPDEQFFRMQAQEFGFDEAAYIEALHKVKIAPESQIKPIMKFYSKLGEVLATMGLDRMHRIEAADNCIREREERLRLVLDGSNDGFWDWNIESGEIYRSPRWAEIFGYSPEELEPNIHIWENLLHPDDREYTVKTLYHHLDGQIPNYKVEYRLLTKSGEWKWVLERGRVVARDMQGRPLRAAGTCTDINERKLNENTLLKSKSRMKAIIDNIPFYVYLLDGDGEFVAVNNAYCQECGVNQDEIIGKTVFDIYPFEEAAAYWAEDLEVIKSKQQKTDETLVISKGRELWVEQHKQPILDNRGNAIGMVGLLRDITEKKNFEKEVGRLDQLNLVGEIAASIGHEIRNPMTSVRGFLQIFETKYSEDGEALKLMIEELDRANAIITEFLSLAKNRIIELKPTDLNLIVQKIKPLIEANAVVQEKRIKIETEDIPYLLLDEKEIRQLILNLVRNGMEAMSQGGDICIMTFMQDNNVVLSIKDQGHGIPNEIMEKLGTPFFTTKENGTGLGLAVCYGIATRHNAKIEIKTSSTGTTFHVKFPVPASIFEWLTEIAT